MPHKLPFEQRLEQEVRNRVKERAKSAPHGREREILSRKAQQLETSLHINECLSSPGLKPPE